MKYPPVNYSDYLSLDKILSAQHLRSEEFKSPAHDELLFITVHQTYELWFKQILFELNSVYEILKKEKLPENDLSLVVPRMERVVQILKFINGQIDILESMTPLDFLDFRDMLFPASGFQSLQFRKLEIILGLKNETRMQLNQTPFQKYLKENESSELENLISRKSLFDLIESWLERTPFIDSSTYSFWQTYQESVEKMFQSEIEIVSKNNFTPQASKDVIIQNLKSSLESFKTIFKEDPNTEWPFRLSKKAFQAALFINIYRDLPILNMPFRLLQTLMDIDETLTMWRYRHAQMALRMLGKKVGTGGSSGHDYLKKATEQHRVYQDFFSLTTYLIPRSMVPKLPKEIESLFGSQF